jgi:hypothetical protein
MFTKIKLVLAAVLVLGAGSLAQAANENDGGNETGGFVMPGSMDGVNPGYHPRWFPAYGARAYGYAAPSIHKRRPVREQTQSQYRRPLWSARRNSAASSLGFDDE